MSFQSPMAIEAAKYRVLRSDLIEQFGLNEDDEALLTTLDGESDIMDQLAALLRRAEELEINAEIVALQQKRIADRKAALEAKAAKLKRIVVYYMELCGRKKIEEPDFTYVLAKGRKTLVGNAEIKDISSRFLRVKYEVDRAAIKKAIEAGEIVEGFSLSNGPSHLRSVT